MTTRDDVLEQMALADAQSYGPGRSSLWAEAVNMADAIEDEELCILTRLFLANAYFQGNEPWKILAPFSWVLARYEERPDLFDADYLAAMALMHSSVVSVAAANPAVSVEQVRALLKDVEVFCRRQGASLYVVHGAAHDAAYMMGRLEEAEAALVALRSTPPDSELERGGFSSIVQVMWSTLQEDWENAVAAATPVLKEDGDSDVDPADIRSVVMLALLASGRPQDAWDAHVRSYRVQRDAPDRLSYMGEHLEYLALSGHVDRGLRILREREVRASEVGSAWELRHLLIGAALVLREAVRAGRGKDPLAVTITADTVWFPHPEVPSTVTLSEASQTVADWAMALSSQYDRRNGNTVVSQWTQRALSREPFFEVDDSAGCDPLAMAGVQFLEQSEGLPKILGMGVEDGEGTDSGAMEDAATATSLCGEPTDSGTPAGTGGAGGADADGDSDADAFPVVDLRLPPVPADEEELLTRFAAERRRPGSSDEYNLLVATAVRWGYQQDPQALPAGRAQDCRMLRAMCAQAGQDFYTARKEIAGYLEHLPQEAPVVEHLVATVTALAIEVNDKNDDDYDPDLHVEQLARVQENADKLTRAAEELLDAPAEQDGRRDQLALAYRAAVQTSRLLVELGNFDGAAAQVALATRIVPVVADMRHPSAPELPAQLEMQDAIRLVNSGDLDGACTLANQLVHRYDPCPFVLALGVRAVLARACLRRQQTQETLVHARETLNIFLASEMVGMAAPAYLLVVACLKQLGRFLEAAEVLETALSSPLPPVVKERLRRAHVEVLDALDEDAAVLDASLEVAESALARGDTETGIEYLERAAWAAEVVDENSRSCQLYERAAELVDGEGAWARIRRAWLLRRAARAAVDEPTVRRAHARLDKARALMIRALELLEDKPLVSADCDMRGWHYDMGGWHYDMAWILWRTDENLEALEYCSAAVDFYMRAHDHDEAARALALVATVHSEMGDEKATREVIARVRALLAHSKEADHPALRHMDSLEADLDES